MGVPVPEGCRRAREYRSKARALRSVALRMRSSVHRINLLVLADSFEKLAERVEARVNEMAAAD